MVWATVLQWIYPQKSFCSLQKDDSQTEYDGILSKEINQSKHLPGTPVSTKNLLNNQKFFCFMISKVLRRMGFKLNMLIYYRTFL